MHASPATFLAGIALTVGLALAAAPVRAEETPPATVPLIREIAFRGNDVTVDAVMQREISIAPGQPADAAAIERSRQSIQNLGLFRQVKAEQEPLDDGVRVVFTVKEKWYLLGYPRLSANTEGENSLGAEVRWNNLFGRNHSLRALVTSDDHRESGRGRQLSYIAAYRAPFVFGSPYTLDLSGLHSVTPVSGEPETASKYDETRDEMQVLVSRKFGFTGSASQGWNAGGGLVWRRQDTQGENAPEPYGTAVAAVAQLSYTHVQDLIYSEVGTRFGTRFEIADQNIGSDYSYSNLGINYKRSFPIGSTPHQSFEWTGNLGSYNNGPPGKQDAYALGGAIGLRGYQRSRFEGDYYYLVTANYLRPLYWNWLRVVAGVEGGNVFDDADEMNMQVRWSFNLGLRVRVTRLVNFEFEAGLALPLDHDSGRFYGSRYGF